jgi:hypothetical protein
MNLMVDFVVWLRNWFGLGFGFKDEILLPLFQLDSLLRFFTSILFFSPQILCDRAGIHRNNGEFALELQRRQFDDEDSSTNH